MNPNTLSALSSFVQQLAPEMILGLAACVLFLGGTWHDPRGRRRNVLGIIALAALALAGVALAITANSLPTVETIRDQLSRMTGDEQTAARDELKATVYAAPVLWSRLALFFKVVALVAGAVLILFSWDEVGEDHAAEYHGCMLLIVAGMGLTAAANDLVTLFLALELTSIPTYIMLYLPRSDATAQEAAMKYFMLSIFSSALLLFGFSYLYGVTGTTNLPAITEALGRARAALLEPQPAERMSAPSWQGLTLVAMVMVVAGLGFRITAVPFHFYAPDVYQGTTTGAAALLAFVPKVVGFSALLRVLGLLPAVLDGTAGGSLGQQVTVLLWIMAAVTMSLGNILALLQDNLKRLLAYSSVAHAGYMLIGLAVAPRLAGTPGEAVGGVESLLFYLLAYGAMTVGAFAVLYYLSTSGRNVENVDDLAGLGKSHPGLALLMVLFLFSLIGLPLTAGFIGKFRLFFAAMGLSDGTILGIAEARREQASAEVRLYRILALIGALNAAIGAWYYLRIAAVMYLREAVEPLPRLRPAPVLASIWVCALLTFGMGVWAGPVIEAVNGAVSGGSQRSEVRSQRSEVRDLRSEIRRTGG
jgi:NADH-quinone oxidoreductase subunit N